MELLIGAFGSSREILVFHGIPRESRGLRALVPGNTTTFYRSWSGLLRRLTVEGASAAGQSRDGARGAASAHVRMDSLVAVRAIDPWPSFELEWRDPQASPAGVRAYRFKVPAGLFDPDEPREAVAGTIVRFLQHVDDLGAPFVPGWFGYEEVALEPVAGFPSDQPRRGYRQSGRLERLVARFAPLSPGEYLLGWLASSPDRPWRNTPREAALSESHLYIRRGLRGFGRLPLRALRARLGDPDEDAIYVFGRRTYVVLPFRRDDPLRPKLDLHLPAPLRASGPAPR